VQWGLRLLVDLHHAGVLRPMKPWESPNAFTKRILSISQRKFLRTSLLCSKYPIYKVVSPLDFARLSTSLRNILALGQMLSALRAVSSRSPIPR